MALQSPARAGNVIGGGDWTPCQLIPDAIAAFGRGEPPLPRQPTAIRPWQDVLDCLPGCLALAEGLAKTPGRFGGEWSFGPDTSDVYTVAHMAEALASHWHVTPAWRCARGNYPREGLELRDDCSKARRYIGWTCRLSTGDALEWVAICYLQSERGESAGNVCHRQIGRLRNLEA